MNEMITPIHTKIYTLVFEIKQTDEKVMGFLKP